MKKLLSFTLLAWGMTQAPLKSERRSVIMFYATFFGLSSFSSSTLASMALIN
jgi:hypothetical protein